MPRKSRKINKKRVKRRRKTRKSLSRKKLKYYKKKFRKFTKKRRKRRKKKTMKGGSKYTYGCTYPKNIGGAITGYANNKNPFLPDPNPLNSNLRSHKQSGGGLMYDFGLGDLLLNYYKATNMGNNVWHRYKGNKNVTKAEPTHQPELRKNIKFEHNIGDLSKYYEISTAKAAKNTLS